MRMAKINRKGTKIRVVDLSIYLVSWFIVSSLLMFISAKKTWFSGSEKQAGQRECVNGKKVIVVFPQVKNM